MDQIVRQLVHAYVKQEVNRYTRKNVADGLRSLALNPENAKAVSKRYATLDRRMQGRIKWTAMRDGCNLYRREARAAWKNQSVKNPTGVYRKAIARGHQLKRAGRDFLYVGATYRSTPKARVGPLLEWGARKFRGYQTSTKTFERVHQKMRKTIGASFMVQVLKSPECAKGRREAVKAAISD